MDSEHSTESTVTINPFIYSTHHYWMGPVVESEIVTGIERALVGGILELELMFCLVALMTCKQAHSTQVDAHLHAGHSLSWTLTKVCVRA